MQKKQGRRPWCSLHFAFLLAKKVIRLRTRCTFAAEISGSLGQTQWSKLDFFSETLQIWLQNTMIKIRLQIWLPQATNFLVLLVRVVVWVGAIQNDKNLSSDTLHSCCWDLRQLRANTMIQAKNILKICKYGCIWQPIFSLFGYGIDGRCSAWQIFSHSLGSLCML